MGIWSQRESTERRMQVLHLEGSQAPRYHIPHSPPPTSYSGPCQVVPDPPKRGKEKFTKSVSHNIPLVVLVESHNLAHTKSGNFWGVFKYRC